MRIRKFGRLVSPECPLWEQCPFFKENHNIYLTCKKMCPFSFSFLWRLFCSTDRTNTVLTLIFFFKIIQNIHRTFTYIPLFQILSKKKSSDISHMVNIQKTELYFLSVICVWTIPNLFTNARHLATKLLAF